MVALDAAGNVVWSEAVGGTGADGASAVAVDPQGNIYVGGEFTGQVDFDPGPGTRRLGSSGGIDGFLIGGGQIGCARRELEG